MKFLLLFAALVGCVSLVYALWLPGTQPFLSGGGAGLATFSLTLLYLSKES